MKSSVNFVFSKAFFAEILGIGVTKLSFVIIRYSDEYDIIDRGGIVVEGVSKFWYDIESGNFIRLSANHTFIPAKVVKRGDNVIFSTEDAMVEYSLESFYRYYCEVVANSLIRDDNSRAVIPTIKKNNRYSGHGLIRLKFGKLFWSRLLHVDQKDISYGVLMVKFLEPDTSDSVKVRRMIPVLKIKGISKYYYSIDLGRFFRPENANEEIIRFTWFGDLITEYLPAKVGVSKQDVSFLVKNGEKLKVHLADIYRSYMTRVVNSLLLG